MTTRYSLAVTFYSLTLVGFLLFILMWSLGMKEDAAFTLPHLLACAFVVISIGLLCVFPYLKKSIQFFGLLNCALLLTGLGLMLWVVVPMDLGFGSVTFLFVFIVSNLVLVFENLRVWRWQI